MAAAKDPNPKLSLDELAARYGYAASFFNQDKELYALISRAVQEQWSVDKFKASFVATNWYRSHADTIRTWLEAEIRDPASAQAKISQRQLQIWNMAQKQGVTISDARIQQMARESLMFGYDQDQLQWAIGAEYHYLPGQGAGGAATTEMQIRQMAGDYGVQVSDQQMGQWVGGVVSGRMTQDNFAAYIRDMAKSKYASLGQYIDQGMTVKQIAAPYVQSYSNILEQGPDAVSMNDPMIQRALQGVPDPKTGVPQQQTVYDFERSLRQDPRWLNTKNARQSMENTGLGILRDMGLYR